MRQIFTIATAVALVLASQQSGALSVGHNRTVLEAHGFRAHHLPTAVMQALHAIVVADADAFLFACGLPAGDLNEMRQIIKDAPPNAVRGSYSLNSTCESGPPKDSNVRFEFLLDADTDTSNHINVDCDVHDVCVTTVLQGSSIFPLPTIPSGVSDPRPKH